MAESLAVGGLDRAAVLNSTLSRMTPDEVAFFKKSTGITDDASLKEHIAHVGEEAYKVRVKLFSSGRCDQATDVDFFSTWRFGSTVAYSDTLS